MRQAGTSFVVALLLTAGSVAGAALAQGGPFHERLPARDGFRGHLIYRSASVPWAEARAELVRALRAPSARRYHASDIGRPRMFTHLELDAFVEITADRQGIDVTITSLARTNDVSYHVVRRTGEIQRLLTSTLEPWD